MSIYDCVWYWVDGTERGEWRIADHGTREKLREMGYVSHNGNRDIGAPEGPPTEDQLDLVLTHNF